MKSYHSLGDQPDPYSSGGHDPQQSHHQPQPQPGHKRRIELVGGPHCGIHAWWVGHEPVCHVTCDGVTARYRLETATATAESGPASTAIHAPIERTHTH